MAAPLLSIITVCRNLAGEIEPTCRSVVGQDWQDFEWIVVDGASTDGTLDVLENHRDRIDTLVSEPDAGPYDAMNKGIAAAKGEYCLFLNGGDRLFDAAVLAMVFGNVGRHADILYGDEYRADGEGRIFASWIMPPPGEVDKLFFVADTLRHQSTFIKRGLFARCGAYDTRFGIVADLEKWIVFLENGCVFEKLGFPVSVFRMGGLSSSKRQHDKHKAERALVLAAHLTDEEIAEGMKRHRQRSGYRTVREFGTWFGPSVYAVRETLDGSKRKHLVFGVPVLKAKRIGAGWWKHLLFSFIPAGESRET
ncbi:MAG: glycosyltransferase [Planctomycetota bacterium]|jgi:glycosyltransferase involved in cell wall biosynthesis|nr:glycosyltransferase [Planctomycetota bacterium]